MPASLIFVAGRELAEHVQSTDVEQVDFDRPPAMHPPPLALVLLQVFWAPA